MVVVHDDKLYGLWNRLDLIKEEVRTVVIFQQLKFNALFIKIFITTNVNTQVRDDTTLCVARFVLNRLWRRNCRDSITNMLLTVKWPSLEEQRKQSRLTLMFKFINKLIYIPSQYLPVLSPATQTRSNHALLKFQHLYAWTNQYSYSFLPRTIRNWNNLNIANIDNIDLQYIDASSVANSVLYVNILPK